MSAADVLERQLLVLMAEGLALAEHWAAEWRRADNHVAAAEADECARKLRKLRTKIHEGRMS